jgi:hypothetical protein
MSCIAANIRSNPFEELQTAELAIPIYDPSEVSDVLSRHVPSTRTNDTISSSEPENQTEEIVTKPRNNHAEIARDPIASYQQHVDVSQATRLSGPEVSYSNQQSPLSDRRQGAQITIDRTRETRLQNLRNLLGLRSAHVSSAEDSVGLYANPISTESSCSTATEAATSVSHLYSPATYPSSVGSCLPSLASTRTSLESDSIVVPVDSPDIYLISEKIPFYVAKLLQFPPPLKMTTEWYQSTRIRLLGDLRLVLQTLPRSLSRTKSIVEPDLCMLGEADTITQVVHLKPTVVIRCGSKRCQKAVENSVNDLGYLKAFSKGRIRVHHGAPIPAGRMGFSSTSKINDLHEEGPMPLVDIEFSDASTCGARIRFSTGSSESYRETFATIGGLIKVDELVYGLTAAHSMMPLLDPKLSNKGSDSDSHLGYDSDTESSVHSLSSMSIRQLPSVLREVRQDAHSKKELPNHPITYDESVDSAQWLRATLGPFSYAETRDTSSSKTSALSSAADFALIEHVQGRQGWRAVNNVYFQQIRGEQRETVIKNISSDVSSGPVSILCSASDVRSAYLLEGESMYMDRVAMFATRKIQTERPFGESKSFMILSIVY